MSAHELYLKSAKEMQKDLSRMRSAEGLREVKTGKRPCLKCDNIFLSKDLRLNKICNNCKNQKDY